MHAVSALLLAAGLAAARPLKQTRAAAASDLLVMNFALALEGLETQFYQQAMTKFTDADYQNAGFSSAQAATEQIMTIQGDEAAHQKSLNSSITALGGTLLEGCQFNFDSVLTDVATFTATARVVELVGVGAYLGAASLVQDPVILETAGSILTVEARHQTVLNIMSGTGSVIPQAVDLALTPPEVLAIAGQFISGCDTGIKANTALKITNTGTPAVGTALTFSWDGMPSDTSGMSCQMMIGGNVNTISLPIGQCVVPAIVNGPVAIWITADNQPLLNNVVDRNPTSVAGPAVAFIDSKPDSLSQLIRAGSGNGGSSSTEDITPTEASGVASAAGASATGSSSDGSSSTSGPNLTTGASGDGSIQVMGWANLPPSA